MSQTLGDIIRALSSPQPQSPQQGGLGDLYREVLMRLMAPQQPPSPQAPQMFRPSPPYVSRGLIEPGNVDLYGQPEVRNPDGSISTVDSIGVGFGGHEYLLPRVTPDGRHLSSEDAIREFQRSRLHLGIFDTPDNATAYAQELHREYERGKYRDKSKSRKAR